MGPSSDSKGHVEAEESRYKQTSWDKLKAYLQISDTEQHSLFVSNEKWQDF